MGRHDTYGSALSAQPGESQRRPPTNTSSQLNVQERPAHTFVLPVPLSRMVAPYATVQEPRREIGTAILIPVTNPIESVFATVRHRTVRTKGSLSPRTAKLMVFKLVSAAAKTWRRLKGENQLPKVVRGVKFQNGIEVIEMPANHAA